MGEKHRCQSDKFC